MTAVCVLPGCDRPSEHPGVPCGQCVADFGGHLRRADGPPLTAEQVAARDAAVRDAYAQHLAVQAAADPGVCPDCAEGDHCGDDRCSCCEEAYHLARARDACGCGNAWCCGTEDEDEEDEACGCDACTGCGDLYDDDLGLIATLRPVVTLQPAARYL